MKNTIITKIVGILCLIFALSFGAAAQQESSAEPGAFGVGEKVEAEYVPGSGKWIAGEVVEVVNDGYSYKIRLDRDGDGRITEDIIHFKRVRRGGTGGGGARKRNVSGELVYGKYGCTSSQYSGGSYEYTPRGSFVIADGGGYAYYGFEKPSRGTFTISENGTLNFKNGYLDGGEATPLGADYPNRFYLVFPTIPGGRWTCGLMDK